jgi:metal-responsive CopG/Arc/MetJ family transcriptional regulator
MAKRKTTVYLDEDLLRDAQIQAARSGRKDSELIEEAVRNYLGLDILDEVWARSDLDEDSALKLAYEALDAARRSG